jgi:hypothetical protein
MDQLFGETAGERMDVDEEPLFEVQPSRGRSRSRSPADKNISRGYRYRTLERGPRPRSASPSRREDDHSNISGKESGEAP